MIASKITFANVDWSFVFHVVFFFKIKIVLVSMKKKIYFNIP